MIQDIALTDYEQETKEVCQEPKRKSKTPLRHILRNYARSWGEVQRMAKHVPGVWWFSCKEPISQEICEGFLACTRDFDIKGLPNAEVYKIAQLNSGEGVFAFVEGKTQDEQGYSYDDMDHFLLQWFSPTLAKSIFERGYLLFGHGESWPHKNLESYWWFLDQVMQKNYPEVFSDLEASLCSLYGIGEFTLLNLHLPGAWAYEWSFGNNRKHGFILWERLFPIRFSSELEAYKVGEMEGSGIYSFNDCRLAEWIFPDIANSVFYRGYELKGSEEGGISLALYKKELNKYVAKSYPVVFQSIENLKKTG